MKKSVVLQLLATCLISLSLPAIGQVVLTGTNYTQNFNGIGNGLPAGWSVRTNSTTTSLGSQVAYATANKTWGDSTGEFGNCASTVSNSGTNFLGGESTTMQGNCTNRSLAVRQTAAFGDPGAAFILQISNTLGVSNLAFSVDMNMLKVNANSNVWTVDYAVGNNPTAFTLLGTNSDPGLFGSTHRVFSLGTDANNQPASVWIRIAALSPAALTSTRDTFSIDNFILNYNRLAVAPALLSIKSDGNQVVLSWDGSGWTLQAAPDWAETFTNLPEATSPFTNAMDGPARFFRLIAD